MSDNAYNTMFRQEIVATFEQEQSLVRKTVTTEVDIKGNTATFLVAGSGSAEAVTRGANGMIPARADSLTQTSATLVEWHDLARKNNFNIYAGQGDQRKLMQRTTMAVMNRKIDADIIAALHAGTQYAGLASETASLALVTKVVAILGNAFVPLDGNISALITPAFYAYLMQVKEFASVDYINNKPFENMPVAFRWAGVNFIVHPNLTGAGTSTEYCIFYHRNAIGHACDMDRLATAVGYNDEQDYSYARCTGYMGSKLLQNTGVVQVRHDGSAYAATT